MTNDIILRRATLADMWDLYKLSNSPEVRAVSFHQDPITREEHEKWYQNKLSDDNCIMFVITNNDRDFVGSIRFDKTSTQECIVSILINQQFRGRGVGTQAIKEASKIIMNNSPTCRIKARILKNNIGSLKSFLRAGYQESTQPSSENNEPIELIFP